MITQPEAKGRGLSRFVHAITAEGLSTQRAPFVPVSPGAAERGTGMLVKEVTQSRDQLPSMRNIVLPNCRAEIIHQHVSDLFGSVLALEQATAQHNSDGLGNVLVLGNGLHLFRRELTEADQIFHVRSWMPPLLWSLSEGSVHRTPDYWRFSISFVQP